MKLNKTQQAVLRYVFGSDDIISGFGCSSKPQAMPIIEGSREWQFAKELERVGVAKIAKQGPFWYVSRAMKSE